jgi:hypothetical protein
MARAFSSGVVMRKGSPKTTGSPPGRPEWTMTNAGVWPSMAMDLVPACSGSNQAVWRAATAVPSAPNAHGAVDDVDGDGVVAGDFVGDGRRRLELGVEQRDRNLELLEVGAGMSGDGAEADEAPVSVPTDGEYAGSRSCRDAGHAEATRPKSAWLGRGRSSECLMECLNASRLRPPTRTTSPSDQVAPPPSPLGPALALQYALRKARTRGSAAGTNLRRRGVRPMGPGRDGLIGPTLCAGTWIGAQNELSAQSPIARTARRDSRS